MKENNYKFLENIQRRMFDIATLTCQAEISKNNKIKSCYYKSSIFLSSTIVKAFYIK